MSNDYILAIVSQKNESSSGSSNIQQSWTVKYDRALRPLEEKIGTGNTKLVIGGTLAAVGFGVGYLISLMIGSKAEQKNRQRMLKQFNSGIYKVESQRRSLRDRYVQIEDQVDRLRSQNSRLTSQNERLISNSGEYKRAGDAFLSNSENRINEMSERIKMLERQKAERQATIRQNPANQPVSSFFRLTTKPISRNMFGASPLEANLAEIFAAELRERGFKAYEGGPEIDGEKTVYKMVRMGLDAEDFETSFIAIIDYSPEGFSSDYAAFDESYNGEALRYKLYYSRQDYFLNSPERMHEASWDFEEEGHFNTFESLQYAMKRLDYVINIRNHDRIDDRPIEMTFAQQDQATEFGEKENEIIDFIVSKGFEVNNSDIPDDLGYPTGCEHAVPVVRYTLENKDADEDELEIVVVSFFEQPSEYYDKYIITVSSLNSVDEYKNLHGGFYSTYQFDGNTWEQRSKSLHPDIAMYDEYEKNVDVVIHDIETAISGFNTLAPSIQTQEMHITEDYWSRFY